MKTYTVKMSKSVVEYRETLINCENEEELIELLDEKRNFSLIAGNV